MINTDVVLWQAPADNDATVSDLWSTTYSAPKLDDIQNVKLDFQQSLGNGMVRLSSSRSLDTGDQNQDFLVPIDTQIQLSYAINKYTYELYQHSEQGWFSLRLNSKDGTISSIEGE